MRTRTRRLRRLAGALLIVVALVALGGFVALRAALSASLPRMSGEAVVAGLAARVEVTRDRFGVARIVASSDEDAARALGFVHAQDRFFQMDTQRRYAAGELAELVGGAAIPTDRRMRTLRMRAVARRIVGRLPEAHGALLAAYAEGVNAGLADLGARPPEYFLLRSRPAPWSPEDSILAMLAMFDALSGDARSEPRIAVMRETMHPELVAFLTTAVCRFDAPLLVAVGAEEAPAPLPGPDVVDLRTAPAARPGKDVVSPSDFGLGSNNWAVAGWKTEHGGAMLANDMHLMITVPGIWHRAEWLVNGRRAAGVTLPGAPGLVVGTNGRIAWGFTNTYNDTQDHIVIEVDPDDASRYRTPEGWEEFGAASETIAVRAGADETLTIRTTRWGAVTGEDRAGRPLVLKWTALEPEMVNTRIFDMLGAETLEDAVEVARTWRGPSQNVVMADDGGRIAWVVSGYLPRRVGFNGGAPASWAAPGVGWDGALPEEMRPMLVDPPEGILFTANNRTADARTARAMAAAWSPPMRAARIAEMLREKEAITERDMLAMQLDTRASVYDFYRELVREVVAPDDADALLKEVRAVVEAWDGSAGADQAGYRALRSFRRALHERLVAPLVAPASAADESFVYRWPLAEEPVRRILEERPEHFLPRIEAEAGDGEGWRAFLRGSLRAAARAIEDAHPKRGVETPWGEANRSSFRHPLSPALPGFIARMLDMPRDAQGGDALVVRVATPRHGASQRMVVSPGREERGIMHIPAGQSGHFLSRHYRSSHESWRTGEATPLLSGVLEERFVLKPGK